MKPKGKLFALLVVFAAIGFVTATGAFTSVQAERTATVNVANDAGALLAIEPHGESPNGAGGYAEFNNGQVEVDFDGVSGSGVNPNALTEIDYVFNITNQGTQPVDISIQRSGSNPSAVSFFNGTTASGVNVTATNTDELNVGAKAQISIEVDTTNLPGTPDLVDTITIQATAS